MSPAIGEHAESRLPLRGEDVAVLATRFLVHLVPFPLRTVAFLALTAAGLGGLLAAFELGQASDHHWLACCVSLLVLEPMAVACLLSAFLLLWPSSALSEVFVTAWRRARVAGLVTGFALLTGLTWISFYLIHELWVWR